MLEGQRKKIGRNDTCPCGSGEKYKKCHGVFSKMVAPKTMSSELKLKIKEFEATQKQREKQQGLGRPIISNVFKGYRLVAVGSGYYWEKEEKWQTFIDFLSSYLRKLFGQAWADIELKQSPEYRHPLVQWYAQLCTEQRKVSRKKGELFETPTTGAIFAFLTLAYNLLTSDNHSYL